ncbi:hypothetical protein D9611_003962 [Ephemerocybe angulata]|uniref:Transcriptional coactivator p15 (PC4) C-terminal domain-containing protein n=1 Tax=Ephemerocybe angulata TaxID=980116 RepID=A0A8H5EYD3_9AGAR|nr:hypothetical protein D9611_003962 [Tulosesus angulatus]
MAKRKVDESDEESAEYSEDQSGSEAESEPKSKSKGKQTAKKGQGIKKPNFKKRESSDEDEDSDEKPVAKKAKRDTKSKKRESSGDDESDDKPVSKKSKRAEEGSGSIKVSKNKDGEKYLDLGKKKHATVRSFKNIPLLDIREFYVDKASGEDRPGKKGISLTLDQWNTLKEATSTIDKLFLELKK